jgi:putative colanic acid biosynthesis UDP-glucose lipid carrier transferase
MDPVFIEDHFQESYSTSAGMRYAEKKYADEAVVSHMHALPAVFSFPLQNKYNRAVKRSIDIVFSAILILLLLSWLIPVIAILVKINSRGPVFFRQKRNGQGGKLFSCIKFRTMKVNMEADLLTARVNDNRITRPGRILRRHHLDELPQLFNVLAGDMSLIGPRPYMITENLYYESRLEFYSRRNAVKPGITGLAQSFGHFGSIEDMEQAKERFDLDIRYIRRWSLGMDLKILFRTFTLIFGRKPACQETGLSQLTKTA